MKHPLVVLMLVAALSSCERKPAAPVDADAGHDVAATPDAAPEPAAESAEYWTRHLGPDGKPKFVNRLAQEASPYLRRHGHNPVDWYPWGDDAFKVAKAMHRPILLSIGYSTCHWCHVMAEESFEDLEIAKVLNDSYIAVKMDREEHPDVDAIYMTAVQQMTGDGGWPMTVWLTPDGEPFYAATYLPPRKGERGAKKGFLELLEEWRDKYAADPMGVAAAAKKHASAVAREAQRPRAGSVDARRALGVALAGYARGYDATNHGWGGQKFPMPARLRFLLRAADYDNGDKALEMATQTLDSMADGGLFDHVGGGFHRYTVDPAWQTPHFEKMLTDNAQLITTYTEAWQRTKKPRYAEVVRRTVEFLLRDMQAPDGGFYTAVDADSDGGEGTFYLWTPQEVRKASPTHAALLEKYFKITKAGNFEGGRTVLSVAMSREDAAAALGMSAEDFEKNLKEGLDELRTARDERKHPAMDDKIVAAYNGLAIDALARAGFAFNESTWVEAAGKAAVALPMKDGVLRRSVTGGRIGPPAVADDYADVIAGLITLFEVTNDATLLRRTVLLQNQFDTRFWDESGGYFLTAADHAPLLARQKPFRDGAMPSANSVALMNLIRLGTLRDDKALSKRGDDLIRAFGAALRSEPAAMPAMLLGLDWLEGKSYEVVLAGADPAAFLDVLRTGFFPRYVLALADKQSVVPWVAGKLPKDDLPTAYVCQNYTCKLPTTKPEELAGLMGLH